MCSVLFVTAIGAVCAESDPALAPNALSVRELSGGKFAVGLVTFDQKTRELSFPAEVNMTEGALEYAIVHEDGKIHESLLSTEARPLHINIALKLLRYQSSFRLRQSGERAWKPEGDSRDAAAATARFEMFVRWQRDDGATTEVALREWINGPEVADHRSSPSPWIYGGSFIHEGIFQAESSGDIAALFTADSALFNYAGKGRLDDEVWTPNLERTPAVGTIVAVTIKPVGESKK